MKLGTESLNSDESALPVERGAPRGAWGALLVKRPTPDFRSGHDLTVREFEPCVGLCITEQSLLGFLSLSLSSLCPSPAHSLSLSENK